ncbi:hydrolase 1, exosortase A system-associated [Pseudorhodoferax sp.]|uniref:hydrolase 1, exosortase A system-associated n=1 Tax=Pseudorhodoferax sp. TaxID=1993553 RepID=UPI002DD6B644|nr:hydrolase 1, exosortase A system-associated [Pseudorhodoferax sp.]
MNCTEQALTFDCEGETLTAILSLPRQEASGIGVVVVVGGPQYRAGSHRQFVQLARALAAAGHTVLRFDCRGMGDSSGALRDFRDVTPDIAAAVSALQNSAPQVRQIVLWGLCDAATAALLYCGETRDPRVRGLCLFNPWVRSAASLAQTQVKHYYTQRLREPEFWKKLASGRVALSALSGLLGNIRLALAGGRGGGEAALAFQTRMARAWAQFDGPMLLFLSGSDYTAKEFIEYSTRDAEWQAALAKAPAIRHVEPDADHTLSQRNASAAGERCTLELLALLANPQPTQHPATPRPVGAAAGA